MQPVQTARFRVIPSLSLAASLLVPLAGALISGCSQTEAVRSSESGAMAAGALSDTPADAVVEAPAQPPSNELGFALWSDVTPTTSFRNGPARPPAAAAPPQLVTPTQDDLAFEPSENDRPSLGTGFTGHRAVPAATGYARGLGLGGVDPQGPLGTAGVRNGDVLLAVGKLRLAADDDDPIGTFRRRFPAELSPDERVDVVILRGQEKHPRTVAVRLGRRPPRFDQEQTPAEWLEPLPLDARLAAWIDGVLALNEGDRADYESVVADQRQSESTCDAFRLRETVQAHLHPASQEALARELTDRLSVDPLFAPFLAAGLPGEPQADPIKTPVDASSLVTLADAIEAFLIRTARRVEFAYSAWTPRERAAFPEMIASLTSRMNEGSYLHDDADIERQRSNRRLMTLLRQVDREVLAQAAARTHEALDRLLPLIAAAAAADGRPGLLLARDTSVGRIEFWGDGRQRHKKRCAFRFDLGGDDRVLDVGGCADLDHPVSIHVDWDGDDLYGAREPGRQGAALGGIGVLIDRRGNDQYLAHTWSQGACVGGYGLLLDLEGDDIYRSLDMSQGAGLLGAGVLLDGGGNDGYTGHRHCQGAGFAAGVGALVDLDGGDRYACTGRYPSEYGEPGVFSGWGQGAGFGFRHVTSGGIGVLHDHAGDDVYEAGNFSQGGGYFYAWGILRDDSGNDRYVGSRYAMGFAAHQASGTFLEGAGDDLYQSHADVANGLSWDETSVLFHDLGGNDIYQTQGFSLGAAAHNGLVVFLDSGGDDRYPGPLGRARPNTYHGGHSFALVVDAGGGDDHYGPKARFTLNGHFERKHDRAFILDLPVLTESSRFEFLPNDESDAK